MKRELRLTFEDDEVYRVRPGASVANLTYDGVVEESRALVGFASAL